MSEENKQEEKNEEGKAITIKKDSLWKGATFVFAALLIISLFTGGFGLGKNGAPTTGAAVAPTPTTTQPAPTPSAAKVSIDNSPLTGNANAKVTVVEFTDFSCPYCEAASGYNDAMAASLKNQNPNWQPIVSNLLKDYVDTGKVRLVTKYSYGHTGGHPAQSVAWCLNDQNLFWKFYPLAFAKASADVENLDTMKAIAKSIGADMTKLQSCLDTKKYDSQFTTEQTEAQQAGVSGTPSFLVGKETSKGVISGTIIVGAQSYSTFKQAVDAALAA